MSKEFLQTVKAGDDVALSYDYGQRFSIKKVARVTPTQIIVDDMRFNRSTGRRCGSTDVWNTQYLHEPTNEIREKTEREYLVHHITRVNFSKVSLDSLRKAHELLCKATP